MRHAAAPASLEPSALDVALELTRPPMRRASALVGVLSVLTGCSAAVDDVDVRADDPAPTTHGVVVLEQHVTIEGDDAQSRVSARFLRLRGGMDRGSAERIVAAPSFDVDAPEGCRLVSDDVTDVEPTDGSIELLDVGDVTLHVVDDTAEDAVPLAARAFPDVGDLVSGVIYTSRGDTLLLPSASTYLIETSGSAELDGFTVQAEPPEAPRGVRVGGSRSQVVFGEPLELSWDLSAASGRTLSDRVQLELRTASSEAEVLRCVLDDDGYASIAWPGALAGPASVGAGLEMTFHRHRRIVATPSSAMDDVVVDFDFSTQARFVVVDALDEG